MSYSKLIERLLFEGMCSIDDPAELKAFLDQTCVDNPALRERLEQLYAVRDSADQFFEPEKPQAMTRAKRGITTIAPDADENASEPMNTRIGRYRLLEKIGEGGGGVVYLAEQMEPVQRRVALKILRLGMDTDSLITRFEIEQRTLAMMDHPNIAPVYDAGATDSGRPFFVMQWVEGERITTYCDKKRSGLRHRMELFLRVCHAIQHAHQKGVIHRDIKPSNVIVTDYDGMAVPKVIDFGVSMLIAGNLSDDAAFSVGTTFVGTPAYMSPEQAAGNGSDVDTRSDVYSLGALLYELLTGCPPFDPVEMQGAGIGEIRRILSEELPMEPSAWVAALDHAELDRIAGLRSCSPQKLPALLNGDLDHIVMMAMEKDRALRYGSVDSLAADIGRYLNDEPVLASPSSRMDRWRRLVRRNRVSFTAGAIVVLALILGCGISTWMYYRENQARHEQARLRASADQARLREISLREAAENREKIAQAAVQVKYGNLSAADQLLAGIPVMSAQPSLESANTFRAAGEWHVAAGRWKEASERYSALAYAITQADATDSDEISRDMLLAAYSLWEAGDIDGYERLRQMAISRFEHTMSPVVAEQIIKICLILPAGEDLLARLARYQMIASDLKDDGPYMAAWRAFAMALLEYRRGDYPKADEWVDRCLAMPSVVPAREASARFLRAMVWYRMGRNEGARREYEIARKIQGDHFSGKLEIYDSGRNFWFDWVNTRVLRKESELLMVEGSTSRKF